MVPGRPSRCDGERGFTLVECLVFLAVAAVFTGSALALFVARASGVHAAALDFEALVSTAESLAGAQAAALPGAPAVTGMTISVTSAGRGSIAKVYFGRPEPGSVLPLRPDAALAPVVLDARVAAAGDTVAVAPFSIFIGSGGRLSVAPNYDAASATGTVAAEPRCDAAAALRLTFADALRSEEHAFACATGQRLY
jgi:hypothetical protein